MSSAARTAIMQAENHGVRSGRGSDTDRMGTDDTITDAEAAEMLQHWLGTPRDTLLGQDYGNRISEWLQSPLYMLSASHANDAVRDLRADIPLFDSLPVDVLMQHDRPDKRHVVFEIAGRYHASTAGAY